MTSAPPLRIEPRVSPALAGAVVLGSLISFGALLWADLDALPGGIAVALTLWPGVVAAAAWRLAHPRVHAFAFGREGMQVWTPRAADPLPARVRHARVLGPLIVLGLSWDQGPRSRRATLWLLPDSLDTGQHRAMRMRLSARTHNAS